MGPTRSEPHFSGQRLPDRTRIRPRPASSGSSWALERPFSAIKRGIVTTSYVLDEVVTHLNARGHHARAVRIGQRLMAGLSGEFVDVDRALLEAGWSYFVRQDDKHYSLTDCISFVVMEQRGLRQVLTFDHHFRQAGFECLPD